MATLLHLICVGSFVTWYKLMLYLIVCGAEIYVLKYFTLTEYHVDIMKSLEQQPYGKMYGAILHNRDM